MLATDRHQHCRRNRLARTRPSHTIVTILCDYGSRYQSNCSTRSSCAKSLPVPGDGAAPLGPAEKVA